MSQRTSVSRLGIDIELNSVESSESLLNLIPRQSLFGKRFYLSEVNSSVYSLLYSLSKYVGRYFVSRVVHHTELVVVSSGKEPVDYITSMLRNESLQILREEELKANEVEKLVGEEKYSLVDFYFKLILRHCLQGRGYQFMGRRFWSKGESDILYVIDADLDPNTMKGYVSVDVRSVSRTTLWDKIKRMDVNNLGKLIDTYVIVPYGNGYVYGNIRDFIHKKIGETLSLEGEQLNLFEYYSSKKNVSLDPEECPIVKVEVVGSKSKGSNLLFYPPSQVRLFLPKEKLDPRMRYDEIGKVLKDIIEGFKVWGISFGRLEGSSEYLNVMNTELQYFNKKTHASPLFSMQKLGAKPLYGSVNISELLIILPSTFEKSKNVNMVGKLVQLLFNRYNFGVIGTVNLYFYEVCDDLDDQKIKFSNKLGEILKERKPANAIIIPVIKHSYLFKLAKQICSDSFFHAVVVKEGTFIKIMELIDKNNLFKEENVRKLLENIRSGDIVDEQLINMLSNIVFSIYVEFILQSEIYNHRIPQKLTWALAKPADGVGKSLYIGYDVSRINGNNIAVAFILYDSYGYMLNAALKTVHGEKISKETLENILLTLFATSSGGLDRRLVIFKDGGIRSKEEYNNIISVLTSIGEKVGFRKFDVIGVIKGHNLRLFTKKDISNPPRGVWVKVWDILRNGVYAERALIVSSQVKAGGTVKPVLLERYGKQASEKTISDIVNEYLRLCRLDYWNPLYGLNKYPLPLFMADKLAYLALQGVPIKTP